MEKEAKEAKKAAEEEAKQARKTARATEARAKEVAREAKEAAKLRKQTAQNADANGSGVQASANGGVDAVEVSVDPDAIIAEELPAVTPEEQDDWLGEEDEDDAERAQRAAAEAIVTILDSDDDEEDTSVDWRSGAPVEPPQQLPDGAEDLEEWKQRALDHTIKRAKRNYTLQAEYKVEHGEVYTEQFPLRIAAYYHPSEGLALLKADCHKMGKCPGKESGLCDLCKAGVPVYSEERKLEIAIRSWGFFHLPSHQREIEAALC